nr:matrix metalloproteinase 3 precursor - bovine (fragments) [Bos taurus]
VMRKPRTFPG